MLISGGGCRFGDRYGYMGNVHIMGGREFWDRHWICQYCRGKGLGQSLGMLIFWGSVWGVCDTVTDIGYVNIVRPG